MLSIIMPMYLLVLSIVFFIQELTEDNPSKVTVMIYFIAAIFASIFMLNMNGAEWVGSHMINVAG